MNKRQKNDLRVIQVIENKNKTLQISARGVSLASSLFDPPPSRPVRRRVMAALDPAGLRCTYCYKKMSLSWFEREHVVPVSKGGENKDDNIVPACGRCNRSHGNKSILLFFLIQRIKKSRQKMRKVSKAGGPYWKPEHSSHYVKTEDKTRCP